MTSHYFFITHTHYNLNKKYLILIFYSFYDLMGASVGVPCNAPWPWCMSAVLVYRSYVTHSVSMARYLDATLIITAM